MRWTRGDRGNIEDLRGRSGGGMGMPLGIGGVLILLVGSWLTGVNLFDVVGGGGATDVVADRPAASSPEEERLVDDGRRRDGRHSAYLVTEAFQLSADAGVLSSATPSSRRAACRARQRVLSIVLATGRSISISRSSTICTRSWERPATSRRHMCWPTRSATTCRISRARSRARRSAETRTSARCAWSCRPTATPASGATRQPSRAVSPAAGSSWIPATSRKD